MIKNSPAMREIQFLGREDPLEKGMATHSSAAAAAAAAKSLQSCLTLCDPMDCSPPGTPVRGLFQARVLEWVAIAFSDKTVYSGLNS